MLHSGHEIGGRGSGRGLEDAQHRRGAVKGEIRKWQFALRRRQVVVGGRQHVVDVQAEGKWQEALGAFPVLDPAEVLAHLSVAHVVPVGELRCVVALFQSQHLLLGRDRLPGGEVLEAKREVQLGASRQQQVERTAERVQVFTGLTGAAALVALQQLRVALAVRAVLLGRLDQFVGRR